MCKSFFELNIKLALKKGLAGIPEKYKFHFRKNRENEREGRILKCKNLFFIKLKKQLRSTSINSKLPTPNFID